MKWILIFFCLPAFGQLPVLPFAPTSSSSVALCVPSTFTVSSGTNLIYLDATCTSSITNTVASNLTNWFDLSGTSSNSFFSNPARFGSTQNPPLFRPTGGNNGKRQAVFYFLSSGATHIEMTNALNISQPITVVMFLSITNNTQNHGVTANSIFDDISGSREIMQPNAGGGAGMYAGSFIGGSAISFTNQWLEQAFIYDGANSVWMVDNTNFVTGNPGANGTGAVMLGTDVNGQSQGCYGCELYLLYKGHLTTNDLTTIYNTIKSNY